SSVAEWHQPKRFKLFSSGGERVVHGTIGRLNIAIWPCDLNPAPTRPPACGLVLMCDTDLSCGRDLSPRRVLEVDLVNLSFHTVASYDTTKQTLKGSTATICMTIRKLSDWDSNHGVKAGFSAGMNLAL
ncbi:hypothetical protein, partial [Rubinisphaera sp.]|uniref:hypothetical protein n=1 Tax=Rubinisphaera sp. TaxID=2024857 RepID=UPI0025CE6725